MNSKMCCSAKYNIHRIYLIEDLSCHIDVVQLSCACACLMYSMFLCCYHLGWDKKRNSDKTKMSHSRLMSELQIARRRCATAKMWLYDFSFSLKHLFCFVLFLVWVWVWVWVLCCLLICRPPQSSLHGCRASSQLSNRLYTCDWCRYFWHTLLEILMLFVAHRYTPNAKHQTSNGPQSPHRSASFFLFVFFFRWIVLTSNKNMLTRCVRLSSELHVIMGHLLLSFRAFIIYAFVFLMHANRLRAKMQRKNEPSNAHKNIKVLRVLQRIPDLAMLFQYFFIWHTHTHMDSVHT